MQNIENLQKNLENVLELSLAPFERYTNMFTSAMKNMKEIGILLFQKVEKLELLAKIISLIDRSVRNAFLICKCGRDL